MPQGLIDAHVHLLGGGQALSWADLRHADSKEAFTAVVETATGWHSSVQIVCCWKCLHNFR